MNNKKIIITTECCREILFADTDAGGMMYFGQACRFIETGIKDWFKQNNLNYLSSQELNIFWVVRELKILYDETIKYNENIKISTSITYIGRFYLQFSLRIFDFNNQKKLQSNIKFVSINKFDKKTVPIPEDLFQNRFIINNLKK